MPISPRRARCPSSGKPSFAYNFALAGITLNQRIDALIEGLKFLLGASPFYAASIAAWAAGAVYLLLHEERLGHALTHRVMGLLVGLAGLFLVYNGLFRSGLQLYQIAELSAYRYALIAGGVLLAAAGLAYFLRRWDRPLRAWIGKFQQAKATALLVPLAFVVIDLPVEIILSSLSGNNFRHYFMAVLPAMTILIGYLVWSVLSFTSGAGRTDDAPGVGCGAGHPPVYQRVADHRG